MCHVNATLKCVLLFETWFVVIASSSSFSQLLFLGCQPGCYRLLNLFTLEITNLKCGRDKVVNTKYTIHIPYELGVTRHTCLTSAYKNAVQLTCWSFAIEL